MRAPGFFAVLPFLPEATTSQEGLSPSKWMADPSLQAVNLDPAIRKETPWWSHFMVLPDRRLLVCGIEEAGQTLFNDLMCSLEKHHSLNIRVDVGRQDAGTFERGCSNDAMRPIAQGIADEAELAAIFKDPTWTRAVVLRDPLDRFLASWVLLCLDKRTESWRRQHDRQGCQTTFGVTNASFTAAVSTLNRTWWKGRDVLPGRTEDHWRLQSAFCNGTLRQNIREKYNFVENLTREAMREETTLRNVTIGLLSRVGIEVPEAEPGFRYHFPSPRDATFGHVSRRGRVGGWFIPLTRADREKHYDTHLARTVLGHYAPDYSLLGLDVPRWAVEMAGAPFVRSLGLTFSENKAEAGKNQRHRSRDQHNKEKSVSFSTIPVGRGGVGVLAQRHKINLTKGPESSASSISKTIPVGSDDDDRTASRQSIKERVRQGWKDSGVGGGLREQAAAVSSGSFERTKKSQPMVQNSSQTKGQKESEKNVADRRSEKQSAALRRKRDSILNERWRSPPSREETAAAALANRCAHARAGALDIGAQVRDCKRQHRQRKSQIDTTHYRN